MPKSAYRLALMLLKYGARYHDIQLQYKMWEYAGWMMVAQKQFVTISWKSNDWRQFCQFDINPQSQFGLAIRQA